MNNTFVRLSTLLMMIFLTYNPLLTMADETTSNATITFLEGERPKEPLPTEEPELPTLPDKSGKDPWFPNWLGSNSLPTEDSNGNLPQTGEKQLSPIWGWLILLVSTIMLIIVWQKRKSDKNNK